MNVLKPKELLSFLSQFHCKWENKMKALCKFVGFKDYLFMSESGLDFFSKEMAQVHQSGNL